MTRVSDTRPAPRLWEQRAWLGAYLAAVLLPVVMLALSPRQENAITAFAIVLGFAAFVGMALQVVMVARIPGVGPRRGIGLAWLVDFHRYMGAVLVLLVTLHVAVIFFWSPWSRSWLWLDGPLSAKAGTIAFAAMLLIAATSIWRRRLSLSYETWRVLHVVLTAIAVSGAYLHILQTSDYSVFGPVRLVALAAFVAAWTAGIYLRFGRAIDSRAAPYVLLEVSPREAGAVTLRLAADGHAGQRFAPGQYAFLSSGDATTTLAEHPFSFSSSPQHPDLPELTVAAAGDHTAALARMVPGTRFLLDGPHGGWEPPDPAAGLVLLGAGIGITPIMSIARTVYELDDPRPTTIIHAARSRVDLVFADAFARIDQEPSMEWIPLLDEEDGLPTADGIAARLPEDVAQRNAFICGPPGFVAVAREALLQCGIPRERIHAERFTTV